MVQRACLLDQHESCFPPPMRTGVFTQLVVFSGSTEKENTR